MFYLGGRMYTVLSSRGGWVLCFIQKSWEVPLFHPGGGREYLITSNRGWGTPVPSDGRIRGTPVSYRRDSCTPGLFDGLVEGYLCLLLDLLSVYLVRIQRI